MSTSSIPNLHTLRRDGQRGRGRGRGGSGTHIGPERAQSQVNQDEIIQNTDNDAATSRQSAVDAGYLEDPFSAMLISAGPVSRRLPLMNRGTYVRTTCIDRIVDTFLSSFRQRRTQVVSLGAGSDTRYFRLKRKRRDLDIAYHEIDFQANTRRKIAQLRGPAFSETVKNLAGIDMHASEVQVSRDGSELKTPEYHIHPQDLRQLQTTLDGVDTTLPTLIISECCLIYLHPGDADAVVQYFSQLFPSTTPLAIAIYEPIRPNDSFGKTMVSNLLNRGIQLQTLEKYSGLDEQRKRLEVGGFGRETEWSRGGAEARDIDFIWRSWIAATEKERVEGLEWMDEVEEFVLLAKHYCICWGWRGFEEDSSWRELSSLTEQN